MSDAEKAALSWLDEMIDGARTDRAAEHARTLRKMLAEPRLPAEPTAEALKVLREKFSECSYTAAQAAWEGYRALHAHLSRPATRTVETWEVRYAFRRRYTWCASSTVYTSREACETFQRDHQGNTHEYACWSIVGPIAREVPA